MTQDTDKMDVLSLNDGTGRVKLMAFTGNLGEWLSFETDAGTPEFKNRFQVK